MHFVITGANRGIGLEFCRQALARKLSVTALCRQTSPELSALGCRVVEGFDVCNPPDLSSLGSVDFLILNAGIWRDESLESMNFETMREQFEVNTLGPLRVVTKLYSHLREGSKVALMTSQMGSMADNSSGGRYGYRSSKAALNSIGVSLARDLEKRGIAVGLFHPGYVATDMTQHRGSLSTQESVAGLFRVLDNLNLKNTGTFWNYRNEVLPW